MKNWCKIIKTESFDFLVEILLEHEHQDSVKVSFSRDDCGKLLYCEYIFPKGNPLDLMKTYKSINKKECAKFLKNSPSYFKYSNR